MIMQAIPHDAHAAGVDLADRLGDALDDDDSVSDWEEFVLPHIDAYDRDHYETVWSAVVRVGPSGSPYEG